jgi:transcription antitermination factor NusG
VKALSKELYKIVRINRVKNYIKCDGIPCVINDAEISIIKQMIETKQLPTIEDYFTPGEKVKILAGPLIGCEGILIQKLGKFRFGIKIEGINHLISIEVDKQVLERIRD